MKRTFVVTAAIAAVLYGTSAPVFAGTPGSAVPNSFSANTTAKAAEVNANFSEVVSQIGQNATSIATNATNVANNTTDIATNTTDITTNTNAISSINSSLTTLNSTVSGNGAAITALQGTAPTVIDLTQYQLPVGTTNRTFAVSKPTSSTVGFTTDTQTITKTATTVTETGTRKNAGNTTVQAYTNSYTIDADGTRHFTQRVQENYSGGVLNNTVTTTMDHPELWPAPIPKAAIGQSWGGATTLTTTTVLAADGSSTTKVGAVIQTNTLVGTIPSYTTSGGTTYNDCIGINFNRSAVDDTIGGYFTEARILCKGEGIVATIRLREEGSTGHWMYELQ